jgi:hypothetical protein
VQSRSERIETADGAGYGLLLLNVEVALLRYGNLDLQLL